MGIANNELTAEIKRRKEDIEELAVELENSKKDIDDLKHSVRELKMELGKYIINKRFYFNN